MQVDRCVQPALRVVRFPMKVPEEASRLVLLVWLSGEPYLSRLIEIGTL